MKNAILSDLFSQMADVMEILGEDPFRISSYRKVSRIIADAPADVEALLDRPACRDARHWQIEPRQNRRIR